MATLKDTSAMEALNEDQYINSLYDKTNDSQKQLLQDNYTQNTGALDTAKQDVQKQTEDNLGRTYVEAAKTAGIYNGGTANRVSAGANQQAALTQSITKQQNVSDLQKQQNLADAEIERQRKLLADQYAAEIKKAQADNDMGRAEALLEAAKAEEAKLLEYKKQAAAALAQRGDKTLYDSLLEVGDGTAQEGTTTGTEAGTESAAGTVSSAQEQSDTPSWTEVLKHEAEINGIYDAKEESARQDLLMDYQKAASDLEAQRQAQRRKTDAQLNDAYVEALRKGKNYSEVQGAYGQGSGTAAQAQLARDSELLRKLTDLRGIQTAADAESGVKAYEQGAAYRKSLADSKAGLDANRLAALIKAAEEEEATLAANQELVGQEYAKSGDYTILAKLWGLTPEQLKTLMPPASGGGYTYRPPKPIKYTPNLYETQVVPNTGGIKTSNYNNMSKLASILKK